MKRMEELIHLNKKINFEGKVTEVFVNCSYFLSQYCLYFAQRFILKTYILSL